MPEAQNFKNHAKLDPPFHFLIVLVLIGNVGVAVVEAFHDFKHAPFMALWRVAVAVALAMLAMKTRIYSLRVQDRVIRTEERLRFAALLPADVLARTDSLTSAQWVALRFASDSELPALVYRTLVENLTPKQIKESINAWRPDYTRV